MAIRPNYFSHTCSVMGDWSKRLRHIQTRIGQAARKVIKCKCDTARQSHVESTHKQTTVHCKTQGRSRIVCSSAGSVSVKRDGSLLRDLGYEMTLVLAVEVKATELILHREGIGRQRCGALCGCKMRSDPRGWECAESAVTTTWQISAPNLSAKRELRSTLTLGYVNMAEERVLNCRTWQCVWALVRCRTGRKPRSKIRMFVTGDRGVS